MSHATTLNENGIRGTISIDSAIHGPTRSHEMKKIACQHLLPTKATVLKAKKAGSHKLPKNESQKVLDNRLT